METMSDEAVQAAKFEVAKLLLERLPFFLMVTSGFCLIQVFTWGGISTYWPAGLWILYSLGVIVPGWLLIRRLSVTYAVVGINQKLVEDINNLAIVLAFMTGLIWAFDSFVQFYLREPNQWLYVSALAAIAVISAGLLSYNLKAALLGAVVILLPLLVEVSIAGSGANLYFICFAVATVAVLYFGLRQQQRTLEKNIALRSEAEALLKQQEATSYLLEQHWQNAPLPAIQWDRQQRITGWNFSAEKLFGYPVAEVSGRQGDFLVPPGSRESFLDMWQALIQKDEQGYYAVHEVIDRNGQIKICEWHNTPLTKDGKLIGVASFIKDVTSQIEDRETIKRQANYDNLTALPNRSCMMSELDAAISRSKRNNQFVAVIFLDLDNFKDINDTQGHHVGDMVLQFFAELLRQAVRKEDVVARFGGDEFVVLIQDLGTKATKARARVLSIADKIMELGKTVCKQRGLEYEIDVSGGIVLFQGGRYSPNDLLKQADLAMYRVKNFGRKGFSFYDDSLAVEAEYRVSLIRELRQGVENKEFDLHFQPIVNTGGDIVFAESLLRWNRPSERIVAASEFIEFMATLPMMNEVGLWIFESACANLRQWIDEELWSKDGVLFVNISPKQLENEHFAADIRKLISKYAIDPHQLVLEITEESLIHNLDEVEGQLQDLLDLGLRIALDDFGTGYSSLAMLQKLPVHFVKLDRSFINDLASSENTYSIVKAVIKLCQIMSLDVIAEGVETEEQYRILADLGCEYFQGYYFSKPVDPGQFRSLVRSASEDLLLRLVN